MKQVVVTATPEMPVCLPSFRSAVGEGVSVAVVPLPFGEMSYGDREDYWQAIARADGLLVRTGIIPYELVNSCSRLKIIAVHGAGVDQVDVRAATEAGIYVTNAPGSNAQAVAELVFGMLLSLWRQIPQADYLVRLGQWEKARTVGRELAGKRLGLVGFGHIGQRVAALAAAFGMEVVYWSRAPKESSVARRVSLEELFRFSQVVSIHLPLTMDTQGLVGRRLLSLMPKDAVLINTARGAIMVEADLLQALNEGWFAGAALDVFHEEPLAPQSPFHKLPNVILTPHMAGSTQECLSRIALVTGRDVRAVLQGTAPQFAVNAPWQL
ncbi:MAG: hydroxyacid dehydrogenase [Peptococcaceae bacterium]|nr:hydroxyacid dehydrogenase [Peptococcaceae bacterium]